MTSKYSYFTLIIIFLTAKISNSQSITDVATHQFNSLYEKNYINRIAFPIGGIGAGMFCIEGTGAISHMSVRNNPQIFSEPTMFAAISIKGQKNGAKVLEGPIPDWKKYGMPDAGKGNPGSDWGLPRFEEADFLARFPFSEIHLKDKSIPLDAKITGWSPFIPTDADNSSLPVGALEYTFKNTSEKSQDYVFSYNSANFMTIPQNAFAFDSSIGINRIKSFKNGFILSQTGKEGGLQHNGDFAIYTDQSNAIVDHAWFRGGWFDPLTMAWNLVQESQTSNNSPLEKNAPGASIFVPFTLLPGQQKTIRVMMAWYVPDTRWRFGRPSTQSTDTTVNDQSQFLPSRFHKPWYSSQFKSIEDIANYWAKSYDDLKKNTLLFSTSFYKSTIPPEVIEAVSANLTILKSPTTMRQYDGRFWGWEGCYDDFGSCHGSCTHVWNYAQSLSHLFPTLEKSLRNTEFGESQDAFGHQSFRSALPIRPVGHSFYAAADGQLGGIMKVYREWRISGDSNWLRKIYPSVKKSLDYCIKTWDPNHTGTLVEPHHNTYDIEFWGADPMCTSFYLGALKAFTKISTYLHGDTKTYKDILERGKKEMEEQLYNGEYFYQKIQWTGLNAKDPVEASKESFGGEYSKEALRLLQKEGPKYQYGKGCLSDGVIGEWMAYVCGLPNILDSNKIKSHLLAVYKYNFKQDLFDHSNPQRSTYALGHEGGLLLCTWPNGGKLSLPFIYSNEVWTGIEYQVASHLIINNHIKEGLDIVKACRNRYDGRVRNPFDEYECGHWYARAMSSYALIEALTGVRYDAVEQTLYVDSKIGDFTSFLSTASGFGNVIYSGGKVRLNTVYGKIPVKQIIIGNRK